MPEPRPPFTEAPNLKRFSMHIRHGFFGRAGGVSAPPYRSLNCGLGSADLTEHILENRKLATQALGCAPGRLITLRQVHSAKCVTVSSPFALGETPEADALATREPNLVLGVLAADCAPVLLCDPHASVIGAAHAGWRGAVAGVVDNCIEAMIALGADPSHMSLAVGPCLSQESFEVGPDMVDAALEASPWAETLLAPGKDDRQHFDLKRYILGRAARAGVAHLEALAGDTLTEPNRYFSYRLSKSSGEKDTGRNLSAIALVA